jgi:hypothetical protein
LKQKQAAPEPKKADPPAKTVIVRETMNVIDKFMLIGLSVLVTLLCQTIVKMAL